MAKLTTDSFKTNLKEGKYSSAGGARKALGKAQEISKADKASLASSIDKHFGAAPAPAKADSTKAPAAAKKTAAKKTPRKTSAKGTKTAAKKTATRSTKAGGASSPGTAPRDGGNEVVEAARDLIDRSSRGMEAIKANCLPGVESAPAIEVLQDHIVHGSKVLDAYLTQLENADKEPAPEPVKTRAPRMAKAPEPSKMTNGASDKASKDFEESLPGASAEN